MNKIDIINKFWFIYENKSIDDALIWFKNINYENNGDIELSNLFNTLNIDK